MTLLLPDHAAKGPEPIFAGFTRRHRDRHLIAAYKRDVEVRR